MNSQNITILKLNVPGLSSQDQEQVFRQALKHERVLRIDVNLAKELARVVLKGTKNDFSGFGGQLRNLGFSVEVLRANEQTLDQPDSSSMDRQLNKKIFEVHGISCASCEVKIERALGKIPGVNSVDVDARRKEARVEFIGNSKEKIREFNSALADFGYVLKSDHPHFNSPPRGGEETGGVRKRPKFWELVMLFILVWTVGALLNRLGILKQGFGIGSSINFTAAFVFGLISAASQCLAVVGGLLLGLSVKFREKYGEIRGLKLAMPILLFSAGRIGSYAIFGGLIGFVGEALSPSPFITGIITIGAALLMIAIGLNILNITPGLLVRLQMRAPKGFMRKIHDLSENSTRAWMPAVLGAATFFIPCGFTQSLQIYALGTGNFAQGALALGGFALGTVPALFALWYAGGIFRGRAGQFFFRFAGAAVLLLGIWNVGNGLTAAGYPPTLPKIFTSPRAVRAADTDVIFNGREQVVKIDVNYAGYSPDEFTVKQNIPVRLEVSGETAGLGCLSTMQIPKLGVRQRLVPNQNNVITFTPDSLGDLVFSCGMGMFGGTIHVVPNS